MLEGFTRKFKPLEVLTEAEIESIWEGIFNVLEEVGLKFDMVSGEALKIFEKGGCYVDHETKMVKFPRDLVEACLKSCPKTFRLRARDSDKDIEIGEDRVYIQPGPGLNYLDLDTFKAREPTLKEYDDAIRVYDALPHLHYFHPLSPNSSFQGIPSVMALLEVLAARLRNSTKANSCGTTVTGDHAFAIEMARVVDTNLLWVGAATSPLIWSDQITTGFIAAAKAGFPLSISSGALWGLNAPATIAGEIISACVENIGIVVLAQLIRPGHPVHVKLFTMPLNMRSGTPFFGNIAIGLSNAAFHQVWRKYHIPTGDIEPAISNSKCMDFQSGYEKGMLALASALSGAHTIWIHGTVFGELTAHPVQAVMDDDISGMVGRFVQGVNITEETMALNLIKQVGPSPGIYLDKEHTMKWWRHDQFLPAAADTTTLQTWIEGGKKAAIDLARERMEDLLASHQVSRPLTASQSQEIERILEEARRFYRKRGKL